MGDVNVSASTPTPGAFAVDGTLTIDELDYNHAADGFDRLDWNTALDLDADGFIDLVDPGADLTPPVVLTINLPDTLHYRVNGNVTSTDAGGSTPLLTAGPVTITGSADFALSRWDVNLGTLDSTALVVEHRSHPGHRRTSPAVTLRRTDLAIAQITPDGETQARYTAHQDG